MRPRPSEQSETSHGYGSTKFSKFDYRGAWMDNRSPGPPYLSWINEDSTEMLALADELDLAAPVPTCPGWSLGDLVGHLFSAHRWVTSCVKAGTQAQQRDLPAAPSERTELTAWARQALAELLSVLWETSPNQLVWTPLRGPAPSIWWRRKAAVEAAIHRWDAHRAVREEPHPIAASLALAGIDEFSQDFLPPMLMSMPEPPPASTICLEPTDISDGRVLTLRETVGHEPAPHVRIRGTASDLLLWMWNRIPPEHLKIEGDPSVAQWWRALVI
ncbi:hypothetical protein A5662_11985 [Mycobacteriaceae bacterium 1482268.1]|nr:hypothetical protein A5662_11985 [Mycobacteriaceae bacterium 1482268.1]